MTHTTTTLPPLPEPYNEDYPVYLEYDHSVYAEAPDLFTAEQMRAYARAALAQSAPAALDPEALIRSCVPGGSVCDPQQVADAIRRYLDAWPQPAQAPVQPASCDLGVGCEKYGVCYAEAHGAPERCGREAPAQPAPSVEAVMERARDVRLAITKQCMDPCAAHVAACDRADSALRSAVEALAQAREDSDRAARYESSVAAQALADLREAREALARGAR